MTNSFTPDLRHRAHLLNTAAALIDAALSPAPLQVGVLSMLHGTALPEHPLPEHPLPDAIEPPIPPLTFEPAEVDAAIAEALQASEAEAQEADTHAATATEAEPQAVSLPESSAVPPISGADKADTPTPAKASNAAKTVSKRQKMTDAEKKEKKRLSNLRYRSKQAKQPAPQSTPVAASPVPLPHRRPVALPSVEECGNGFYDDDPNRGLGGNSFAKVAQ